MIQNTIKVLTLGFFISMITGFVLYRSGYFDAEDTHYSFQTSPNGGELNSVNQIPDSTTTPEINKIEDFKIMPSSKSGRAFDLEQYKSDNKAPIMPSTKVIIHPIEIKTSLGPVTPPKGELVNPYVTSTKKEVPAFDLKTYEQKKENELRMSSSKSVILTDLQWVSDLFSDKKKTIIKAEPEVEFSQMTDEQLRMASSKSITFPINVESLADLIPEKYRREFFKVEENEPEIPEVASRASIENEEIKIEGAKRVAETKTTVTIINWRLIGIGVLGILFVGIGSIVYFKRKSK